MRSSSIKSAVTAAALAATLILGTPAADARPAQTRETVSQREEPRGPIDRAARVIKRLVSRITGGIATNNWPLPPLP